MPRLSLAALLLTAFAAPSFAEPPLHERIDRAVAAGEKDFDRRAAPLASDAEFLRRVTLDLTGTLPTAADARAFLKDTGAEKRARLIDRLLASPEAALRAKLAGNVAPFVATFAGKPGQPPAHFEATLDQALFLANGKVVRGWLAPRPGNLTDRLTQLNDAGAVAEELSISTLTRLPTDEERKEVADFLKGRTDYRTAALEELAGALLASAEFRFYH